MNKTLFFTLLFALSSVMAWAGKDVRVKSGDVNVLKEKVAVVCQVDLEGATWEEDETFKQHCGEDYDLRVKLINESWPKFFAQYSEGPVVAAENPKYNVVFKLTNLDNSIAKSMWGKIGVELSGEISFIDVATGQAALVITVDGENGKYDYVENDRYPKAVEAVCESMFDLL